MSDAAATPAAAPARRGGGFLAAVRLTFAGTVTVLVATTVNGIIVSRALGPEGRGIYALAVGAVGLVWPIAVGGLQHANTYWASRAPGRAPALFWHSLLYVAAVSALLAALYLVWPGWLLAMLGDAPRSLAWLVLAAMGPVMFAEQLMGLLMGLHRFRAYNVARTAAPLLLLPADIVALIVIGPRAVWLVGVWVAVNVAVALLAAALVRRAIALPPRLDRRRFADALAVGGRGLLGGSAGMLLLRVDLFLVGHWAGLTAAGLYATAVLLSDLTQRLPDVAAKVLFPTVAATDTETGDALTVRVIRFTLPITLVSVAGLAAVGRPLIVAAFGSAFAPAYAPLLWLLPGAVALALVVVINHNLGGRGFPRVTVAAPLAALVINLAVDAVTIPRWGASGAAIGSSIAYWAWTGALLAAFTRRSGSGWRATLLLSRADIAEARSLLTRRAARRSPSGA